jgi:putative ABC transport system permease protein
MNGALSWRMLRRHRWSYAGLVLILILAAAVVGSAFALVSSTDVNHTDLAGLTRNQAAIRLIGLVGDQSFSLQLGILDLFVLVFLVSQTVAFIVAERRRELALLRLFGASSGQLGWMVVVETAILAVPCSLIGALLSIPLVGPYSQLMVEQGNWPAGMPATAHVSSIVDCVLAVTAVALAGAAIAATRVGKARPIEAVRFVEVTVRHMTVTRWVCTGCGLALVVVGFFATPVQGVTYSLATLVVAGGAMVLASAIAPLVVPVAACVVGGLGTLIAPGAGLVARQRSIRDPRRPAVLTAPVVLLLGIVAVFGVFTYTSREIQLDDLRNLTHVDAVVDTGRPVNGVGISEERSPLPYETARRLPEVTAITQVSRSVEWSWDQPGVPADEELDLTAIDPRTFSRFVPATAIQGDIHKVKGLDVAVVDGPGRVGGLLTIQSPSGRRLTLHVVARVQPSAFIDSSIIIDHAALNGDVKPYEETWLAQAASGTSRTQLITALRQLAPTASAATHEAWVQNIVQRSVNGLQIRVVTFLAGILILILVSLALSSLTSVRDRRRELQLLRLTGALRRSVTGSAMLEAAITSATGILLVAAVTLLIYLRMSTALAITNPGIPPILPTSILIGGLAFCVITLVTTTGLGAYLATIKPHRLTAWRRRWRATTEPTNAPAGGEENQALATRS